MSTMPFAIDDPSKRPAKASDIYNHGKTGTLRKNSYLPLAAPVVATNYDFNYDDRYHNIIIFMQLISAHAQITVE